MIKPSLVVDYMREQLTSLNGRIYGAATLDNAVDDSRIYIDPVSGKVITSLFVLMGESTASVISRSDGSQIIDQRLIIMAVLDNTADRTGTHAQDEVYLIRQMLWRIFIGWQPPPDNDENDLIQFVRDDYVRSDPARYWHRFEFSVPCQIDLDDGVIPNVTDLNAIYVKYYSPLETADNPIAEDHNENLQS